MSTDKKANYVQKYSDSEDSEPQSDFNNEFPGDQNSSRSRKRQRAREWTPGEDAQLTFLASCRNITLFVDHSNTVWNEITNSMSSRTSEECYERYHTLTNPDFDKQHWRRDEDSLIILMLRIVGTKWSEISKILPGRTDNAVKNRFYSTTRRVERHLQKGSIESLEEIAKDDKNDTPLFAFCVRIARLNKLIDYALTTLRRVEIDDLRLQISPQLYSMLQYANTSATRLLLENETRSTSFTTNGNGGSAATKLSMSVPSNLSTSIPEAIEYYEPIPVTRMHSFQDLTTMRSPSLPRHHNLSRASNSTVSTPSIISPPIVSPDLQQRRTLVHPLAQPFIYPENWQPHSASAHPFHWNAPPEQSELRPLSVSSMPLLSNTIFDTSRNISASYENESPRLQYPLSSMAQSTWLPSNPGNLVIEYQSSAPFDGSAQALPYPFRSTRASSQIPFSSSATYRRDEFSDRLSQPATPRNVDYPPGVGGSRFPEDQFHPAFVATNPISPQFAVNPIPIPTLSSSYSSLTSFSTQRNSMVFSDPSTNQEQIDPLTGMKPYNEDIDILHYNAAAKRHRRGT